MESNFKVIFRLYINALIFAGVPTKTWRKHYPAAHSTDMVLDQGFGLTVLFLKSRSTGKPEWCFKDLSIQRPASSHLCKLAAPPEMEKQHFLKRANLEDNAVWKALQLEFDASNQPWCHTPNHVTVLELVLTSKPYILSNNHWTDYFATGTRSRSTA